MNEWRNRPPIGNHPTYLDVSGAAHYRLMQGEDVMNPNPQTVFIVDDDKAMLQSTAMLLEAANLSCEQFTSAISFLAAYDEKRSGCLVLDMHMPGMHGMELVERLREKNIALPIVVVSGTGTVPLAVKGMKLGVLDFLEKPVDSSLLLSKVQAALELDRQQRSSAAALSDVRNRLSRLTPREKELLKLLVSGRLNKQIAAELGISIKTVENHRARLMQKTGALNAADLTRMSMLVGAA
jgi:FixJ family two-component response regulator